MISTAMAFSPARYHAYITTLALSVAASSLTFAQLGAQQKRYTHADSLRGHLSAERSWWDVTHYDLHVKFSIGDSSISGYNTIHYRVLQSAQRMQIDLQSPMTFDSVVQDNRRLTIDRDGNAYFVKLQSTQSPGSIQGLTIYFHGVPRIARHPPWDGGLVFTKDKNGRPWITIACQGLGASVWYPCKEHQSDEPDSAAIHITVPDPLVAVANGRLRQKISNSDGSTTYAWAVSSPINNYNLIPYIGHYVKVSEQHSGEKGALDVTAWVLDYNLPSAKSHLMPDVRRMLKDFEHWFGPYPFYADGYQIVDAPHLGMEHQSAIAYGNRYLNGYLGHDLSSTGWGMKWDFIVVHESGHEWFGNNITTKDLADMWVHESFTNYSETLFTTSEYGVEAGNDYVIGTRNHIQNDAPIIGNYEVNEEGSGDMYYKGGNMIHMIRQIINDDEKFRQILRGLNKDFYHQTVTTAQIENYVSTHAGIDFSKVFDQYLRKIQIPQLTYSVTTENGKAALRYRWTNCVAGFNMAVRVSLSAGEKTWLKPTTTVQTMELPDIKLPDKIVDRNFYVGEKKE